MPSKKILILRFSAMGDVVLLVPVLKSLVAAYPDVIVTVVTRPKFASFFAGIERLSVYAADVDKKYKGFFGLRDLFRNITGSSHDPDIVIDMHDHVRTMVLRNLFKITGKKVIVFDKGRAEKKAFTRQHNKITTPLAHTVTRYQQALEKAGFSFPILSPPFLSTDVESSRVVTEWLAENKLIKQEKWIGIAPFAMHKTKIWPVENYYAVIEQVLKKHAAKFFLFGGGDDEIEYFENLQQHFPEHCIVVAGQLKLPRELVLMKSLDLMLCVDSSNMHLAALSGIPLISIWGGTHPDVGFGPYKKGSESIIQRSREELPCIPCSVYGRESCLRGDFACLTRISPADVVARIAEVIV